MRNIVFQGRWTRLIISICTVITFKSCLYGQVEWGRQVVESTMTRMTPAQLGMWSYQRGFYLFGQYRLWKLTGENSYFQYIRDWVDLHVDDQGNIDQGIGSLDNSEPGLITLLCYVETGEEKYKKAADYIRNIYRTYPRTSDGGFWHGSTMTGQLWADGVYMILPFLTKYGQVFGDTTLYTEAANQIITYASHLQDTTGLLFHAYDEDGSSSWADPVTYHSPYFWGRAMGWFGMAIVEILEIIPEIHPKRPELITILADLIEGLSRVQDESTGLWFQIVNMGNEPHNWLESSCSCMYAYFMARAVSKGYVSSIYQEMAVKAYEGILRDKFYIGTDDLANLKDISEGTSVSADYFYYVNRSRNTNDLHGLGAFLMMCWQMEESGFVPHVNTPPVVTFTSPVDSSYFWLGTDITISVNANDMDGQVMQVAFYENDHLLFTDTQIPWEYTWEDVEKGKYILTVVARDDSNATTSSDPIVVFVNDSLFIYEAEEGTLSNGSVDSNNAGFTGTGFVNLTNEAGSYLELSIDIPDSGEWDLYIRYANGSVNNRPCEIRVNGSVENDQFPFPSTSGWTNWTYSELLELDLNSGPNTFRITGITSESAPNLDHLKFIYKASMEVIQHRREAACFFNLLQNYPNPFNPETTIAFSIPYFSRVTLCVYNLKGQLVAKLVDAYRGRGNYQVPFIAKNLPSGYYFYQIQADSYTAVRKMLLLK